MSTSSNFSDKFGREPGQQTVVVQARHDVVNMRHRCSVLEIEKDKYHWHPSAASYDPAINRIDRGNIVFSIGNTQHRGTLLDNAIPVVDQVNGMKRKKKKGEMNITLEDERLAARLADDITVIGVTLGATTPNPEEEQQQTSQITVRAHGTTNILNNSKFTFVPGDTIIWRVPMVKPPQDQFRYGRAAQKITLEVLPLRLTDMAFYEQSISGVMKAQSKDAYDKALTSKTSEFALMLKKFAARIWFQTLYDNGKLQASNFDREWASIEKRWTDKPAPVDGGFHKTCADAFDNDHIGEMLKVFLQVQTDLRSRTLGKSFNYAKPGEMIGALLGVA